jgi:hypothetical protein
MDQDRWALTKKQPEANTPSPNKEEAQELRRILQSDDLRQLIRKLENEHPEPGA